MCVEVERGDKMQRVTLDRSRGCSLQLSVSQMGTFGKCMESTEGSCMPEFSVSGESCGKPVDMAKSDTQDLMPPDQTI